MTVRKQDVEKDRSSHMYVAGQGYFRVGQLPVPANPEAPASECEPPVIAVDGSWHMLQPPKEARPKRMQWHLKTREWTPTVLGAGRRVGFTSEYLAAHGWTYIRASTAADLLG